MIALTLKAFRCILLLSTLPILKLLNSTFSDQKIMQIIFYVSNIEHWITRKLAPICYRIHNIFTSCFVYLRSPITVFLPFLRYFCLNLSLCISNIPYKLFHGPLLYIHSLYNEGELKILLSIGSILWQTSLQSFCLFLEIYYWRRFLEL